MTTIDRGANRDTVIGEGTKIDNLVQIGHNVRSAVTVSSSRSAVFPAASSSRIASSWPDRWGLADNVTIGEGAVIGARSGVMSDVPAGEKWFGYPAARPRVSSRYDDVAPLGEQKRRRQ